MLGQHRGYTKNGAEHATQVHGINADDIYVNRIPANFLCQTIPKLVDQQVTIPYGLQLENILYFL